MKDAILDWVKKHWWKILALSVTLTIAYLVWKHYQTKKYEEEEPSGQEEVMGEDETV